MRSFACLLIAIVAAIAMPQRARAQVVLDTVSAQLPSQVVFAYVQLGDTIALEGIYIDPGVVRGAYYIPKQGRIGWDHQLDADGSPKLLSLSFFPPPEQGNVVLRQMDFDRKADSMIVHMQEYDRQRIERVATQDGAIAVFGRSVTHIAYLGYHAALTKRRELPLYIVSSGKTVNAAVSIYGEVLTIEVDGLRVESTWEGGALLEVRVPSQALVVRRLNR